MEQSTLASTGDAAGGARHLRTSYLLIGPSRPVLYYPHLIEQNTRLQAEGQQVREHRQLMACSCKHGPNMPSPPCPLAPATASVALSAPLAWHLIETKV